MKAFGPVLEGVVPAEGVPEAKADAPEGVEAEEHKAWLEIC